MPELIVAGETLIDFVPDEDGPLSTVDSFARRAGGAPANVAVALSRLGEPPLFWTRIGTDPFGDFLVDTLADAGLPDRYITRDTDASTALALLANETDGRSFTFYRDGSADTQLTQGTVDDEDLAAAEWVHLGGVALAIEPARSAILEFAERAQEHGCTVSVDPNVRPEAWTNDAELRTVTGWLVEQADVLFATDTELERLGFDGENREAIARAAAEAGPHTVVLTLGADGAFAVGTDESPWPGTASHDGFDVDVVDETGAGDAFVAGAIRALADGAELQESLRFANAVGALTTTETGAIDAAPNRDAVEALYSGEIP